MQFSNFAASVQILIPTREVSRGDNTISTKFELSNLQSANFRLFKSFSRNIIISNEASLSKV
jgi:hypothetical protein